MIPAEEGCRERRKGDPSATQQPRVFGAPTTLGNSQYLTPFLTESDRRVLPLLGRNPEYGCCLEVRDVSVVGLKRNGYCIVVWINNNQLYRKAGIPEAKIRGGRIGIGMT